MQSGDDFQPHQDRLFPVGPSFRSIFLSTRLCSSSLLDLEPPAIAGTANLGGLACAIGKDHITSYREPGGTGLPISTNRLYGIQFSRAVVKARRKETLSDALGRVQPLRLPRHPPSWTTCIVIISSGWTSPTGTVKWNLPSSMRQHLQQNVQR